VNPAKQVAQLVDHRGAEDVPVLSHAGEVGQRLAGLTAALGALATMLLVRRDLP